jgi:hypothetical protein
MVYFNHWKHLKDGVLISAVCILCGFIVHLFTAERALICGVREGLCLIRPIEYLHAVQCVVLGISCPPCAVRHKRRWTRAPRGLPSPITSIQLSNQHNKMHEGTPPCHNWHDGYLGRNDFRHNFARIHSPVNFHLGSFKISPPVRLALLVFPVTCHSQ